MKSRSFASALSLAGLCAAFPTQQHQSAAPNYKFAPHVLANWSWSVGHEICSRSVDRLLKQNTDFNQVLKDTPVGTSWTDETFSGDKRIYWPEYRPTDSDDDISSDVYNIEWKRIKDQYGDSDSYSMWGYEGISFADP